MRIALVQTYPIYHDLITTDQWVHTETRDLIIPSILAEYGLEIELWAVGAETRQIRLGNFTLRVFKPDRNDKKTKFHFSTELVAHARNFSPDACILKGVDGGVGRRLIDKYLLRERIPFAFVVGGAYYAPYVHKASCMLIESKRQYELLTRPKRIWRPSISPDKLVSLPKTVNLDTFRPSEKSEKKWDVITSGRLIPRYKDYSALGMLQNEARVAVVGGGPHLNHLKTTYPSIDWIGHVPQNEVATYLRQSKLFVYTSTKDYYPRSIAEATSCGLPTVALEGNLSEDVVAPDRGVICKPNDLQRQVMTLLRDTERLQEMSVRCRRFALREYDRSNLHTPLKKALDLLSAG